MSGYCKFSFDNKCRYVLGKESSSSGAKKLYCIGVNPSTASADAKGVIDYDPTIRRVESVAISTKNGFQVFQDWEMLNLYPQIATHITDLDKHLNNNEHLKNLDVFRRIPDGSTIWAAWGATIEKRYYLKQCLRDIVEILNNKQAVWEKLNDPAPHPHHPLHTAADSFVRFDVMQYLTDLKFGTV